MIWSEKYMYWLALPFGTALVPFMVMLFSGWPYGLLVALLSFLTSLYIWRNATNGRNIAWLCFINFIIMYFMIVLGGVFYGWFLEYKLAQFDLDGDSFFSLAEQTPEQIRYMELLINDLGRNLLFFTGGLYSLIGTSVLFLLFLLYRVFKKDECKDKGSR